MKRFLLALTLVLPACALAQTNVVGPPVAAYMLSGGLWSPATSTTTANPIDNAPAYELYCFNSGINKWVPADSTCFGGGGSSITLTTTGTSGAATLTGGVLNVPIYASSTGLSGMTAAQVPIAATATTVTSSKALAGAGAGITTGPTTSVTTDLATYTGTAGQLADSGVALASVATLTTAQTITTKTITGSSINGVTPTTAGSASTYLNGAGAYTTPAGSGTVTAVSVTTANGVSGSVATATTTPAITLTLGAITPSSIAATGTISSTGAITAGTSGGVGGTLTLPEGTAATAVAANEIGYADSTAHCLKIANNAGSFFCVTQTIASGQTAVPVTALAANTCDASATTVTATGSATTDSAAVTYASDPTALTGYGGGTAGGITIAAWITANTFNFKRCNQTASSITPGALNINWRITR